MRYYAENQAKKGVLMRMEDWKKKLDAFLQFNEEEILTHSGKVSNLVAISLAVKEFEKYSKIQDRLVSSDFDKILEKQTAKKKIKK